jgi:hypothetical protein
MTEICSILNCKSRSRVIYVFDRIGQRNALAATLADSATPHSSETTDASIMGVFVGSGTLIFHHFVVLILDSTPEAIRVLVA